MLAGMSCCPEWKTSRVRGAGYRQVDLGSVSSDEDVVVKTELSVKAKLLIGRQSTLLS